MVVGIQQLVCNLQYSFLNCQLHNFSLVKNLIWWKFNETKISKEWEKKMKKEEDNFGV